MTDRGSFEKVSDWMKQINMYTQREKIGLVLLGNKIDVEPREVKTEEGVALGKEFGIKYFETSALNNINIKESFTFLAEDIISKKNIDLLEKGQNNGNIIIENKKSDNKGEKNKGCC